MMSKVETKSRLGGAGAWDRYPTCKSWLHEAAAIWKCRECLGRLDLFLTFITIHSKFVHPT
jgi:hypothetical protein